MNVRQFNQHENYQGVVFQDEAIEVNGQQFVVTTPNKAIDGLKIKAGQLVLVKYTDDFWGLHQVQGVGEGHDDIVRYPSVAEAMKAAGVKSLKAWDEQASYDTSPHIILKDVDSDNCGGWLHIFKGRWSWGSGSETARIFLLEEFDAEVHRLREEIDKRTKTMQMIAHRVELKKEQIKRLTGEVWNLEEELTTLRKANIQAQIDLAHDTANKDWK